MFGRLLIVQFISLAFALKPLSIFLGGCGGYGNIIKDTASLSYKYLLGLLNSRLLDYFLKQISSPFRGGYFAFNKQYIELIPIHPINFSDPADKAQHDKMVSLVERMLELHKRTPHMPQEQEMVKCEIESTDRQIDALVYELYGLSLRSSISLKVVNPKIISPIK